MKRLTLALVLLAAPAAAQQMDHAHMAGPNHAMHHAAPGGATPTEPGQGAFAAIQEIVDILERDPATDWSRVDIDALRRHLADMDNVVLHANAVAEPVRGGARFVVTGEGAVRDSIRRMVPAHAGAMNGQGGWTYIAGKHRHGATLTVTGATPADVAKIRGLGFFGVMTRGMHHQAHHLMIATGHNPHH